MITKDAKRFPRKKKKKKTYKQKHRKINEDIFFSKKYLFLHEEEIEKNNVTPLTADILK